MYGRTPCAAMPYAAFGEIAAGGGGASFQPAWAARISPVIGSGLFSLLFAVIVMGAAFV